MNLLHACQRSEPSPAVLTPADFGHNDMNLAGILRDRLLRPRFQPLVDIAQDRIFGHESLIRGPVDSSLHMPDALFAQARRQGLHPQLELASLRAGAQGFHERLPTGTLFLNLSGSALMHFWGLWGEKMAEHLLSDCELAPSNIVIELTEQDALGDQLDAVRHALASLRAHGLRIALDDYGIGNSNLQLWSVTQPEFIKIDRFFFHGIGQDDGKQKMVRAIVSLARHMGTPVVAEGIETAEELDIVRHMDIRFAQGWLLGRPEEDVQIELPAHLRETLRTRRQVL